MVRPALPPLKVGNAHPTPLFQLRLDDRDDVFHREMFVPGLTGPALQITNNLVGPCCVDTWTLGEKPLLFLMMDLKVAKARSGVLLVLLKCDSTILANFWEAW